jgi:type IV secretory pathway VirB4 component
MPPPSTTELIPIIDIGSGVITLKDGTLRAIVRISAINFDLRSTDEQNAIIQQFQGFLNSLDFPFQIVVQSRRFDVSGYIALVQAAAEKQTNELLKVQAGEYARFVGELSELANIMSKQFYVVLPFTVQLPQEKKGGGLFASLLGKKKTAATSAMTPEQLAVAKTQMMQRADLIIGGLSGMGLRGSVLTDQEITTVLRDLYNPNLPEPAKTPTS